MPVTVVQIQTEFPEFANTDSGLIGYRIADAQRLVDADVYGLLADDAVKYLACHLIALAPHGEPARLMTEAQKPGGPSTVYEQQYLAIKHSVVQAQMVV
jgi:Protein of unknown function (DUF4054)